MLKTQSENSLHVQGQAWAEIDLGALERNTSLIRSWLKPKARLTAVVKSNAFGHGAIAVAPSLTASGADYLGVAGIEEALPLRRAGINSPILLMSPCPTHALDCAIENSLDLTVSGKGQIADVAKAAQKREQNVNVYLKVENGNGNKHLLSDEIDDLIFAIDLAPHLIFKGVLRPNSNHEANGADSRLEQTLRQHSSSLRAAFTNAAPEPPAYFTNSDMVRVGPYLYGLEPHAVSELVCPVLSLRARINRVLERSDDEARLLGEPRASRLAGVLLGYADGIDRSLSNRMQGLIAGNFVPQIGLISANEMLFDITDVPSAKVGDIVTLIGRSGDRELHLAHWSELLGTTTCDLAAKLDAPHVYTRSSGS